MADKGTPWPLVAGVAVGGLAVGVLSVLAYRSWKAAQLPASAPASSTSSSTATSSSSTPASTTTTTTPATPAAPSPKTVNVVGDSMAIAADVGATVTLVLPAGAVWEGTVRSTGGFALTSAPITAETSAPQVGTYSGGGARLYLSWKAADGSGRSTQIDISNT